MGKGFYLVGFFEKGKKAGWIVDRTKPFEFDRIEGTVSSKCHKLFKGNKWASNWHFVEGQNVSDIDKDVNLRKYLNEIWESWCKKHGRKYFQILKQEKEGISPPKAKAMGIRNAKII